MSEFKARCPKCRSSASLYKDTSAGWSLREGASVLHCRTCGKQLHGEVAEAEVARQYAEWQAAPKVERPIDLNPIRLGYNQLLQQQLQQAKEAAKTECEDQQRLADDFLRAAQELRKEVDSFDVRCVYNLIDLDVAAVHRLAEEIPRQTGRHDIERRLNDIRKRIQDLPSRAANLKLKVAAEVAKRRATPQPSNTPNSPEPTIQVQPPQPPPPEPVPQQPPPEPSPESASPEPEPRKCAWKGCTKTTRPESQYCSADCRNKNARWNYAHKHPKPETTAPVQAKATPVPKPAPPKPAPVQTSTIESMSLEALRKYATHVLKVERASKIPGGKPVLLDICRKAMEQRQLSA